MQPMMNKRRAVAQAALWSLVATGVQAAAPAFPNQDVVCTFNAAREQQRLASSQNFAQPVVKQMLVNGAWVLKAKTKTKKGGAYSFTIKKAVPEGARYSYRVIVYRAGVIVGTSAEKIVVIRARKG